jgi:hypothetical protein
MTDIWPDRPTVYLSTAEGNKPRGGVYHADALRAAADQAGVNLVSLVQDRSLVAPEQQHLVATPAEARDRHKAGDVLVLTSAEQFPAECSEALRDLPLVGSAMTALVPEKTPYADRANLRSGAAMLTAQSDLAWPEFAKATGVPRHRPHEIIGSPPLDSLPTWHAPDPADRRVAIPTLVTGEPAQIDGDPNHPLARVARAASRFPLQAAVALKQAGYEPVIFAHPREDKQQYVDAGLTVADQRTINGIAGDENTPGFRYVVGNGGSLNADLAALSREENGVTVGPAVVALTYDGQRWPPDYVYSGCERLQVDTSVTDALRAGADRAELVSSESIVTALDQARPATVQQADAINGPRDGAAARRLVDAWKEAGRTGPSQNDLSSVQRFVLDHGSVPSPEAAAVARQNVAKGGEGPEAERN